MRSSGRSNRSILAERRRSARLSRARSLGRRAAHIRSRLRGSHLRGLVGRFVGSNRAAPADLRWHPRRRAGQCRGDAGSGGAAGPRKDAPTPGRAPTRQPRRNRPGLQELGARRRPQSKLSRPLVRHRPCAGLFSGSHPAFGTGESGGGGRRRRGDPRRDSGPRPAGLRQLRRPGRALGGGRRSGVRLAGPGGHRLPNPRLFRILAGDRSRLAGADFGAAAGPAGAFSTGRP